MQHDDQQIREMIAAWHAATAAGDTEAVLRLIADDALFLVPGRPPITKAEFAILSQLPPSSVRPTIAIDAQIEELEIAGDLAVLRSHLIVTITPPQAAPIIRSGATLTILRRVAGTWLLARDANLLTIQPSN